MMVQVVKEFCPQLPFSSPKRLEKFLTILEPVECFKFILLLPRGTFESEYLPMHARVSNFMVDFIEEARALGMDDETILDHLRDEATHTLTTEE